jgi:peroxiredoxin
MMRKSGSIFMIVLMCSLAVIPVLHAAVTIPAKGEGFPEITLPIPDKDAEKAYLGLSGEGTFRLSQMKADVVIIEIFSMYCPYCQKEAPLVNDLYQAIDKNPASKNRIKMIGIGAGNTTFEIDIFRKQFTIPFPLFPDDSFTVHKKIGEVRTPHFFVLKMNADGSNRIIYSKVGTIEDATRFLNLILDEAGLK